MAMVDEFVMLVTQFVENRLSARDFSEQAVKFYYDHYDEIYPDAPANNVIAELCLDADALTNTPPHNISADELRAAARRALDQLRALHAEQNKSA